MANWQTLIFIGLGGMLGSVSRFLLSQGAYAVFGRGFPWGTLGVNLLGSFLMGTLVVFLSTRFILSEPIKQGVMVGFLGALTTYSSFVLDKWMLMDQGHIMKAFVYFLVTAVACFCAFLIGSWLAKSVGA